MYKFVNVYIKLKYHVIIGNLMKDLARFLAVLAIFVFGFSMHFVALNQAFENGKYKKKANYFADGEFKNLIIFKNI